MTYLVAYDGGALAETALRRAAALAARIDERLVVVSVLPTDDALAESYDLLEDGEYDPDAAAERLRAAVADVAPDAEFRTERVDAYAGKRQIAKRISRAAREADADVVFVGSDNAGRIVHPVASVGGAVANSLDYDVFVVRSE